MGLVWELALSQLPLCTFARFPLGFVSVSLAGSAGAQTLVLINFPGALEMKNDSTNNRIGLSVGIEGLPLGGRTARTVLGLLLLTAAAVYFDLTPEQVKEWLGLYSAGWMSAWSTRDDVFTPPSARPITVAETGAKSIGDEDTAPYTYSPRAIRALYSWACSSWSRAWVWRSAASA